MLKLTTRIAMTATTTATLTTTIYDEDVTEDDEIYYNSVDDTSQAVVSFQSPRGSCLELRSLYTAHIYVCV